MQFFWGIIVIRNTRTDWLRLLRIAREVRPEKEGKHRFIFSKAYPQTRGFGVSD